MTGHAASEEGPAASLALSRGGVSDIEAARSGNKADEEEQREHLEHLVYDHGDDRGGVVEL